MKVSVITPCYNAAAYIQRTIASVQAQTISDWEMIIVDDGSTDKSIYIVQNIAEKDARILLLRKSNGGSASARKMGLQYAHGEYIQFLDADDTIAPDKLEKQIALMEKQNLDVSYTDWCLSYADGTLDLIRGMNLGYLRIVVGWGVFGTTPIHSFLYRTTFLHKHSISIDTAVRQREDWDFHITVFSAHPKHSRIKNYNGAQYFVCPTGKTTGNSMAKIHQGTMGFLMYRIKKSKLLTSILLILRLSIELCFGVIRKFRYHLWERGTYDKICINSVENCFYTILSICCLPVTFCIIIGYIIWSRIKK